MNLPERLIDILLVEDNPRDAELTERALRRNGMANRLFWVKDGAEALDFMLAEGEYADRVGAPPPRLVLLDLKMPKVTGLEVLARMRAEPRLSLVPVVVMTSSAEQRDVMRSYQYGANSYIVKPLQLDEFMEAIRTLGMFWGILNRAPE